MSAIQLNINFEPSGTGFDGSSDGALYATFAGAPVAVQDGQFIASKDVRSSSISVSLKSAQHGTLGRSPASLLLFEFTFVYFRASHRIKNASINIEFNYSQKPTPPHIHAFCPRHVVGDEYNRAITTTGNVGINVGPNPALVGFNIGGARTEEYQLPSRFTMQSMLTRTHSGGRKVNGVKWVLSENENSHGGIPPLVPIVLLVQRKATYDLTAKISIEAKMSPSLNPQSWRGMRAGTPSFPINVNEATGQQLTLEEGDSFDNVKLESLINLPEYI